MSEFDSLDKRAVRINFDNKSEIYLYTNPGKDLWYTGYGTWVHKEDLSKLNDQTELEKDESRPRAGMNYSIISNGWIWEKEVDNKIFQWVQRSSNFDEEMFNFSSLRSRPEVVWES